MLSRHNFCFDQQELKKMPSVMPLTFNAVDLCVEFINEKPWARVKELCRALEYGKTTKAAGVARCLCSKANYAHNWQIEQCCM